MALKKERTEKFHSGDINLNNDLDEPKTSKTVVVETGEKLVLKSPSVTSSDKPFSRLQSLKSNSSVFLSQRSSASKSATNNTVDTNSRQVMKEEPEKDDTDDPETKLTNFDAIHMCVVLETFNDQLVSIGQTIMDPVPELRSQESKEWDAEFNRPSFKVPINEEEQWLVKQTYTSIIPHRKEQTIEDIDFIQDQYNYTQCIIRNLPRDKSTDLGKAHYERTKIEASISNLITELMSVNTYEALKRLIDHENRLKNALFEIFHQSCETEETIVRNAYNLKRIKREQVEEVEKLSDDIYQWENRLMETKFRLEQEIKYVDITSKMRDKKCLKVCKAQMYRHNKQINFKKKDLVAEVKAHASMVKIIKSRTKRIQSMVGYWQEKYDNDLEELETALTKIKLDRERDLERLAFLRRWIMLKEPIIIDDRRMKEIAERKRVRTDLEIKKVTKLQAMWRGTMVRYELGQFDPRKVEAKEQWWKDWNQRQLERAKERAKNMKKRK